MSAAEAEPETELSDATEPGLVAEPAARFRVPPTPRERALRVAYAKLAAAVALDIADFFIGRIIGFGTGFDLVLAAAGFLLFGWRGLVQLWEVADPTDQIDGFVPTLTLVALAELRRVKRDGA